MDVRLTYNGRSEFTILGRSGVAMPSRCVKGEDTIVFNGSDSILIGEHCVSINPDVPRKQQVVVRVEAQAEFRNRGLVFKGNGIFSLNGRYNGNITVSENAALNIHGSCNGAITTEDEGAWTLVKGSVTNELTNSTILKMNI